MTETKQLEASPICKAALDYASRGLPVFPCNPETKAPMVKGGFKAATTDPEQIHEWWSRWPAAMIGMPTGPVSGIDVLDIDTKHNGFAAVPDYEELSPVIVTTATGGAHLWFKADGSTRNSTSKIALGVDTKGGGGYAIVPPSRRNGAAYVFKRGGLDDLATLPPFPPDLAARLRPPAPRLVSRNPEHLEAPLEEVAALVAAIPNNDVGWDDWARIGMAIWRATGGGGFEIFDGWSAKAGKYDARETQRKWDQIERSPPEHIGVGTLRFEAAKGVEAAVLAANARAPSALSFLATLQGREPSDPPAVQNKSPAPVAEPKPVHPMIPDPGPKVTTPEATAPKKPVGGASLYEWVDPAKLPRRQWLYKPHYIRQFVGVTIAPGGSGKSSLVLAEALALATGKPLLGIAPAAPLKVWYVNLEDPMEELQRRIAAFCKLHSIGPEDFDGRLFVNSGRDADFKITNRQGTVDNTRVNTFLYPVEQNEIDVLIVDPFVAVHRAPENDNIEMEEVAIAFARIADEGNCAVMLVHHSRKTGGEAATVEHGRGASALLAAARTARVLNTMTTREAENAEIAERERRRYFRSDIGKANLTRPAEQADWFEIVSVDLENIDGTDWYQGDHVGAVRVFDYPEADWLRPSAAQVKSAMQVIRANGPWRADQRAKRWVGVPIAEVLGLDLEARRDKRAVAQLVASWLREKVLIRVKRRDEHREEREYVEVGPNAVDANFMTTAPQSP